LTAIQQTEWSLFNFSIVFLWTEKCFCQLSKLCLHKFARKITRVIVDTKIIAINRKFYILRFFMLLLITFTLKSIKHYAIVKWSKLCHWNYPNAMCGIICDEFCKKFKVDNLILRSLEDLNKYKSTTSSISTVFSYFQTIRNTKMSQLIQKVLIYLVISLFLISDCQNKKHIQYHMINMPNIIDVHDIFFKVWKSFMKIIFF
jgi:hypothetical protein